ncbi:MurR/RpiR family transcriptional regulator [Maledivibacter halophilus]|uniref:Transcriptional regulator, RpiR family n=1 Tax=Maledivibacter halophilus TaxID=36842 RepID=A0A1T5LBT5_9FIRM|nr:MurR/RpiR family transcriptional regulator [Maledivibacter halophilus]SKC73109.1 transcriptional regulator, RpiR family [Maledivibacter halophilus]
MASNILIKLISNFDSFTPAEQNLAQYIIDNKESIVDMSLNTLSVNSNVSEATVIRLTKKLGLSGYSEFKLKLSASLVSPHDFKSIKDIYSNDSPYEILNKITSSTCKALEFTNQIIDRPELEKAVSLISKTHKANKNIFIVALGASGIIARDLQTKFMRLGINTIYYEDMHLSLESIIGIRENDLLIVLSTLGKSMHAHHCMEIARNNDASIILITQYGNENIAAADIVLNTANIENNLRLTSQISRISQLVIVDTIFTSLALENDKIQDEVENTKRLFRKYQYYCD